MPVAFKLPDVGEGVAEGELIAWHVEPGDAVEQDQVVAEVETDKALVDVPSPVAGTVRELHAAAGDVVPVGEVLITFDTDEDVADEDVAGTELESEGVADAEAESPGEDEGVADEADDSTGEETTGGRVFAAPSARRLARELDVDIAAVEGSGPGGRVTEGDVRAAADAGEAAGAAETADADEAGASASESTDATAPASTGDETGTGDGDVAGIPEMDELESAAADADADVIADAVGAEPSTATTTDREPDASEPVDRERTLATPATRRVATELDVDIDAVPTDQMRDGEPYVDEAAVREYADAQRAAQAADAAELTAATEGGTAETAAAAEEQRRVEGTATAGETTAAEETATGAGEGDRERREPYRGVRRTVGEHMAQAKYTAPHVTHHDHVDVTGLVEAREKLKPRAEERGATLTYLPFVLKAVVAALREHPVLNTSLDEDEEEIVYKNYYNLGVATATDAGLMVPVVDDVDRKGLLELASEVNELVEKARNRTIAREEMQGGTFSITNFGAVGGEYATPIVNYPETAILGLGAIKERPWVVDSEASSSSRRATNGVVSGEVVPRKVMTLSLSIDHRVIDGAQAAAFTNTLKEYLEDPTLLLLEP
ncbi:MAG: dihydrolipoamide acetyltransferase family protein [Haloarculaceae archaeon]